MFHAVDGWCFRRMGNGDVVIAQYPGNPFDDGAVPTVAVTIPADIWASVISSVSLGGEIDLRFYAAREFHNSRGRIEVRQVEISEAQGE